MLVVLYYTLHSASTLTHRRPGADSRNFLEWLKETVNEAIVAAEQHEQLKRSIRELRASIEDRFLLSAIHVR